MSQIRLAPDVVPVITTLQQRGGPYPRFEGRSAAEVANTLIRDSAPFKEAEANNKAERHPRPGSAKKS